MFGLGLTEIGIILLLLVLFIKPEDVPGFVRKVGQTVGWIRKLTREAKSIYQYAEQEMMEAENETEKHNTEQKEAESNSEINGEQDKTEN